ncbi:MAG: tetratricopeptide repeat protein [Candidatus Omnitrophica bacterium]|nr:tetratricopeptide repeat protein [Candidatus Omnitrophota bacterium]
MDKKRIIYNLALMAVLALFILDAAFSTAYCARGFFDRGPSEDESGSGGYDKSSALKKAEQAFVQGDYEEVLRTAGHYQSYASKTDSELQHLMGRALLKMGRFDEARNRFSTVVNHSDNEELLDNAYIGLADSYFLEGNYKTAVDYYEKILRYFPDSQYLHIVYYRLGECYSALGDDTKAQENFNRLTKAYPYSLEANLLSGGSFDFLTYSVQVASFGKWKNAQRLSEELKKQGFDATIHTTLLGEERFYRVRVGQYNNFNDAEDMALRLKNAGYDVKIYP